MGHGQTHDGHAAQEFVIRKRMRGHEQAARRRTQTEHADGVAAGTEQAVEMGHMQHGGQHIELPGRKAQQQAKTHIAHTGAQGHFRRVEALFVMALGPGHMGGLVVIGMVGILIDQDGAHVSIQQHAVLVGIQRPHVDVDAADFAVTVEHGVHDADGFGQVFHIGIGQLAGDQHDALVALTDQLAGGLAHLGRGHVLALDERIALAIGAIKAFTAAMVRDVQRSGQHDTVTIDLLLDRIRRFHHQGNVFGIRHPHESRRFLNGQ